jgi:hypothetical protein
MLSLTECTPHDGAIDYALDIASADFLAAVALLPPEERVLQLARYAKKHGVHALAALFAEFMGLANSVAANCRVAAESVLVSKGTIDPLTAATINMPTIHGALAGVEHATCCPTDRVCEACAFRLGTWANQSPLTARDARDACDGAHDFVCHSPHDGSPAKQRCRGYAAIRQMRKEMGL